VNNVSLDKKSVVQIVILLALVGGAGVVYLTSQEGGLNLSFITDLLPGAGDNKTEPPAPSKTSAASTASSQPQPPPIPAQPAKGQVGGSPFEPDSVVLEGGVLAFVQSKEPQTAVLIRLVTPAWETPIGKRFNYAPAGANAPLVTVNRMLQGEMKQQSYGDKYTLVLEFDQEKDHKLAGKLQLTLPGEAKTSFAGTFGAEIKGFRFVDGKPDLTSDSTDTLEYLALKDLLKDDPDKKIEIVSLRDGRYSTDAAEKNRAGYLEVEYRVGQGASEIMRYQFAKDSEWKVRDKLKPNQIDEAHPVAAPGLKEAPAVLAYLAAKQLEASLGKKSPNKGVYSVNLLTRHSVKTKTGVTEASYKLDPSGQPIKTAYLFHLKQNGWALERELSAKEKVNVDTGKIEKR